MYRAVLRRMESSHLRIITGMVIIAAIVTMLMANVFGWSQVIDNQTRNLRYDNTSTPVSGNVALVAINDKSIENLGTFPWPRRVYGDLINAMNGQGVDKFAFDISYSSKQADQTDNILFADAMEKADFPIALALAVTDANAEEQGAMYPNDILRESSEQLISIWAEMDENGSIAEMSNARYIDGQLYPTLGPWLAEGPMNTNDVLIDWSLNYENIPTYEVSDIIEGRIPEGALQGKSLVIGVDTDILGDAWPTTTNKIISGARIQITAAETILKGQGPAYDAMSASIIVMALLIGLTLLRRRWIIFPGIAVITGLAIATQWNLEAAGAGTLPIGQALTGVIAFTLGMILVNGLYFVRSRMTKDADTGLPNRMGMRTEVMEPGYTMVVQITNEVDIISTCGSEARDKIMQKIARNIEMATNRKIYHISSGAFAWRGGSDHATERQIAANVMQTLRPGISFANGAIDIYAAIGMAPPSNKKTNDLISQAAIAATRASVRGIAIEEWIEDDGSDEWRVTVVSELERAIRNDDLWIAYQPKIDPKTNEIIGAEALVRWEHPEKGNIRPDAFIPLIEKANRIDELTEYMISRAIKEISRLGSNINIAVNVSPLVMGRGILVPMVMEAIALNHFSPSQLTLEVTESEAFNDPKALEELEELKAEGICISIDDYGTGQSTINYLKIIPATELKIDRSFISNVVESPSDRLVVKSTIGLAHQMGMKVVAEGVENAEVLTFLKNMDCDVIQGYHTGRPMKLQNFQTIVEDQMKVLSVENANAA